MQEATRGEDEPRTPVDPKEWTPRASSGPLKARESMREITIILAAVAMACGGGSAPTPSDDDTSGDEVGSVGHSAPIDDEEEEELIEDDAPTGPGELQVTLRLGNEDAQGRVQVVDDAGEVVAEGASGQTFTVPSGSYRVVGELARGALRGAEAREESAYVEAGGRARVTVSWAVARVRIDVRRRGQAINRWRLVVTREGTSDEVVLEPSNEHHVVMPGRYSGVLTAGANRVEVSGIIFQGGATMNVPINID